MNYQEFLVLKEILHLLFEKKPIVSNNLLLSKLIDEFFGILMQYFKNNPDVRVVNTAGESVVDLGLDPSIGTRFVEFCTTDGTFIPVNHYIKERK